MKASYGVIGGWTISDTYLYGGGITLSANTGSITGGTITGTVFRTASSGQRVEIRGDSNFGSLDTMRFYGFNDSGWVDIRGYMGTIGADGFYINGTTQIGNLQSTIHQVGRRAAIAPASTSVRVRANTFSVSATGNQVRVNFGQVMDNVPQVVVVSLYSHWSWYISGRDTGGFYITVFYPVGHASVGQAPGSVTLSGSYYVEDVV
jgi:hypothetical protein